MTTKGLLLILRSSAGMRPALAMGTTHSSDRGMYANVTSRLLVFTYGALPRPGTGTEG